MRLVADDANGIVLDFIASYLGKPLPEPNIRFGIVDRHMVLVGAVGFTNFYRGGNIELTWVGPGTTRPAIIREIISYAFDTCGCSRISAKTRRGNTIARKILPKAGFRFEGTQRRYFGPERADDALCFVITYEEALNRWSAKHG